MSPAASSNEIDGGIAASAPAGTATSSRAAPQPQKPITRSPGLTWRTSDPTVLTMPANSAAGENGGSGLYWYLPSMISVSKKLSPAALTATTASSGFGTGDGRSSTTSLDAGPSSLHSTAFMRHPETAFPWQWKELSCPPRNPRPNLVRIAHSL